MFRLHILVFLFIYFNLYASPSLFLFFSTHLPQTPSRLKPKCPHLLLLHFQYKSILLPPTIDAPVSDKLEMASFAFLLQLGLTTFTSSCWCVSDHHESPAKLCCSPLRRLSRLSLTTIFSSFDVNCKRFPFLFYPAPSTT